MTRKIAIVRNEAAHGPGRARPVPFRLRDLCASVVKNPIGSRVLPEPRGPETKGHDPRAPHAAELLPLPRRADLRPAPVAARAVGGRGRSSSSAAPTEPARRPCSTRSSSRSTARAPGARSGTPSPTTSSSASPSTTASAEAKGRGSRSRSATPRAARSTSTRSAGHGPSRGRKCEKTFRSRSTGCPTAGIPGTGASSSRTSSRWRSRSSSSSTPRRSARSPRTRPAARCWAPP